MPSSILPLNRTCAYKWIKAGIRSTTGFGSVDSFINSSIGMNCCVNAKVCVCPSPCPRPSVSAFSNYPYLLQYCLWYNIRFHGMCEVTPCIVNIAFLIPPDFQTLFNCILISRYYCSKPASTMQFSVCQCFSKKRD